MGALKVNPLLDPVKVGAWDLRHRIVYAPLTRQRSIDYTPQPAAALYYGQRATQGGLMITEATLISEEGAGYMHTPGIYSTEQIKAWAPVVQAVHDKGATFLCQLWHCGRASHEDFQPDGRPPPAPSAIPISDGTKVWTQKGEKDYPVPRELSSSELPDLVQQFRQAALNAIEAGFDGVEVHGANGYLLDSFFKASSNQRTDEYGGSIEKRAKFPLEVIAAVADAIGGERVGVRLSPFYVLDAEDPHKYALFTYVLEELSKRTLAYVHMIEPRKQGYDKHESHDAVFDFTQRGNTLDCFRKAYTGTFLVAGGHDRASGIKSLQDDRADLIVYGRKFLSNPDLVKRFEIDAPLNKHDRNTFYSQDQVKGYTDYPFMEE